MNAKPTMRALSVLEIQKLVRMQKVDPRVSLDVYFRTAEHVMRQANVFRSEGNLPQLYRLLYAYASIVLDTMSEHEDWRADGYMRRVQREEVRTKAALEEMEMLKPIIDGQAEAWKAAAVESVAPVMRPPPLANGTTKAGMSDEDRFSQSSREEKARSFAVNDDARKSAVRDRSLSSVSASNSGTKVRGEVASKHSMFEGRLPSASATALGAQTAAANPTESASNVQTPDLTFTATFAPNKVHERPSTLSTLVSSGSRHTHSLLPPPPPAPLSLGDDTFSQSIIYSAASVDFQPKVVLQVPTSDEAATDHTRLDTRLKLYGLREKVVRGDGNCQFRALADQLFRDQERHAECRTVVINQLRRAAEEYAPYVPEDYDAYVDAMRRDGTWGDHITLQAAADAYGVAMCVISSYKDNFVVEIQPKTKRSARVCWISFWAEVHYNSIYPRLADDDAA
jgi:hypothetical protein